jgi:hypothetical protein
MAVRKRRPTDRRSDHQGRRVRAQLRATAQAADGVGSPSRCPAGEPRWALSRRKKVLAGSPGHNGQNDPMGRPTKLTPELRVDLERQLADGVPVAVVAQGCRSNGRAARVGVCPRLSLRP